MRGFTSERSDVKSAETHREKRIVVLGRPPHTCGPSPIRIPTPIRISRPPPPCHRPVTVARERNPPWPLQTSLRGPCGRGDGEVLREFGKSGDRHNLAGGNVEDVVGTANEVHLKQTIPVVRMFDLGLKHPLQLHMDTAPDPADGGRVPDELGVVVPLRGGAMRRRLPGQTRRDAVGIEGRTNEGTRWSLVKGVPQRTCAAGTRKPSPRTATA